MITPAALKNTQVFGSTPLPAEFPAGHSGADHLRDYYTTQGYGDGGVLSSAADLARVYAALREGQLLSDAGLNMLRRDPMGQGYAMGLMVEGDLIGHSGGDIGFAALVVMDWASGRIAVELYGDEDADIGWAWNAAAD